jgi:hypothetical protein
MAGYGRGALRGAADGMSSIARSLLAGPAIEQQAGMQEALNRSRIAQAMASAQKDQADADLLVTKNNMLGQRPGALEEQVAVMSGTDLPLVRAVRESIRTGRAPQIEMAGPTEDGSPLMGDLQVAPEQRSAIAQALQRLLPVGLNTGDIKVDDWASALGNFREQDLGDRVIRGDLKPGQVGASQAALAGKPLFNSDASGAVLDLFGGALDVANPMAQASIGVKRETAGAQKANAVQSYAAADNSKASAQKTRAEMAEGLNGRGAKAPTGYRWGADGQTLEYIPGGPADPTTKGAKLAKPPTEGQAKALMFGTRMAVADDILNELDGKYNPGTVAAAKGADTIPLIGGVTGRMATAALGDEGQMALQAQRDFINAILRRESGAVIADSEFANAALQYFPQPGDSKQVLRQKAANRKVAIAGMKAEFGEPLTPDFNRIVEEARTGRKQADPKAPSNTGGASGSWAEPAGGWSIVREN